MRTYQIVLFITVTQCVSLLAATKPYEGAADECDREVQTRVNKLNDEYVRELNALQD